MFKLWGFHPNYVGKDGLPYLILLENGSIRECRAEQKYREKLGGWTLATYGTDVNLKHTWLGHELEKHLGNVTPF